jgi:hypothetical protein
VFVDSIEPALRESGVMKDADIAKLAKQVQEINRSAASTDKAKKIAKVVAYSLMGISGAHVIGLF